MRITKTVVTDSDIVVTTDDGRTITIAFHPKRIYVGVSGMGADGCLSAQQVSANSVDVLVHSSVAERDEQVRRENARRIGDMSS